jgi:DNA polymerase-1
LFFADTIVPHHPLVHVCQDVHELAHWERILEWAAARQIIAWDTETSGFDWWGDSYRHREGPARIIGHCWGFDLEDGHGPRGLYMPIRHQTIDRQLPVEAVTAVAQKILGNPAHQVATHFGKFDMHMGEADGLDIRAVIHDTHILAHLIDENEPLGLEKVIARYGLDPDPERFKAVLKKMQKTVCKTHDCKLSEAPGYQWIPVPVCGPYGAWDTRLTKLAVDHLLPIVQQGWWDLYGVELGVLRTIQHAEHVGVPVDVPYLTQLGERLDEEAAVLERDVRKLTGDYAFEPGNDNQVRDFIYDQLRVPVVHTTDKVKFDAYGNEIRTPSVDIVALSYIKHHHPSPTIEKILEYRKVTKLASTYCRGIAEKVDARGRLHGRMEQMGTNTGRFASKQPNLQNMPGEDPKHPERSIRRAFTVPEGDVRIFLDWSQIELRVLAVESQEPTMLAAFQAGEDLHGRTSEEMFGNRDKQNRTVAKRINFGNAYGLTAIGLMNQLNKEADPDRGIPFVTEEQAQGWFDTWHGRFPRVKGYMEDLVKSALCKNPPQYQNVFGRNRRIADLRALGRDGRRAARQLIASRIQGLAAELTKVSIVRAQKILDWGRETGRFDGTVVLTIHDEIQIDVNRDGALECATLVKAAMEDFPQISAPGNGLQGVPVVCDAEWSATTWPDKVDIW